MPNYKVSDFANMYREENPQFEHLDDTDIVQSIAVDQPDLLEFVDRDDLGLTMKESRKRKVSQERQKTFKSLGGYSRFMAGTGQGMLDIYQGIKQIVGGDTKDYQETKKEYLEASEGDVLAGLGELTGSLAATAPIPGITGLKVASKVANPLLKTATKLSVAPAIGATMGASEFVDEDETRLKNTLYGSLFGAGGAAAGALVKKVGTKAFNALKGKYKNANIQELSDLAKTHNIKLSKGDLTQKPLSKKAEVAAESKVGGLAGFREEQAQDANRIMKSLVDDLGKKVPLRGETGKRHVGKELQESVKRSYSEAKKVAEKNYNKVEKLTGGAKIEPTNSLGELDKVMKKAQLSDVPTDESTQTFFDKLGENLSTGKKNLRSLRATRESLGNEAAKHSINNPGLSRLLYKMQGAVEKDMDSVIDQQVKSMTKRKGRAVAKSLQEETFMEGGKTKKLLMADDKKKIASEMMGEAEKQVKKAEDLKLSYETAKTHYRKDVVPFNANRSLRTARQTDEPSQIYKTMIQSDNPDRAANFYKSLDKPGKEAVEFEVVNRAFKKSATETPSGTNYSPAKFISELDRMDEAGEIFFTRENASKVKGIKKLMRSAIRAGQYMENPPTGNRAEIAKELRNAKLTMGLIPLLTQAEKFFWTGKGKDFLLASSKLEPGSIKMQDLIEKIYKNIPKTTTQTAKEIEE